MLNHRLPLLIGLCYTLASCVSFSTQDQNQFASQSWVARQQQLKTLQQWHVEGALSFKDSKQSVIASYSWQQRPNHYVIVIHSALNVGAVKIIGEPNVVTLTEGKQSAVAPSASELMQQQLGWHLPITNLRYWVRGLPAPGQAHIQLDQYHHLIGLEQDGWQIRLSKYVTFKQRDVPQELDFNQGPVAVKLIVRWQ